MACHACAPIAAFDEGDTLSLPFSPSLLLSVSLSLSFLCRVAGKSVGIRGAWGTEGTEFSVPALNSYAP